MGRIAPAWVAAVLIVLACRAANAETPGHPETYLTRGDTNAPVIGYEACPVGFVPLMNAVRHIATHQSTVAKNHPVLTRWLLRVLERNRLDAKGSALLLPMIDDAVGALRRMPGAGYETVDQGRQVPNRGHATICPREPYPLLPAEIWKRVFDGFVKNYGAGS